MEAIPLNGLKANGIKSYHNNLKEPASFYPFKSFETERLPANIVAVELVDQIPGKEYDSIDSNSFLFSESGEYIDINEYAIIKDDEDDYTNENVKPDRDSLVSITSGNEITNNGVNGIVNGYHHDCQDKAISDEDFSQKSYDNKPWRAHLSNGSSDSKADLSYMNNVNEVSKYLSSNGSYDNSHEKDTEVEKDLPYSYENTLLPNSDHEMKVLAGRNNINEISTSLSDKEVETESHLIEDRNNTFKLRHFSTPPRIPSLLVSSPDSINLELLRNIKQRVNRINSFYEINNSNHFIKPITTVNSKERKKSDYSFKTNIFESFKLKRPDSDKCPRKRSTDLKSIKHLEKLHVKQANLSLKNVFDETFFVIDNRYDEFISTNNIPHEPIEIEMQTIKQPIPSDYKDYLFSNSTEFTIPVTSLDIIRKCKVSSRYISFLKQPRTITSSCKCISIAFFNVNKPKKVTCRLDVPYEEVVEQVYTHVIEEVLIYEDEYNACHKFECSICDDEWFIIK